MLTMNMTPGREADIIWVIRINMDGSYLYFSTEFDKITLDGIDFDGKVLFKDGFSNMEEGIIGNAVDGGNISIVSNFTFAITRYNDYSGASNFFNDFYPATSKPLLTSKTVDVGIIWRGATTLAEITWIKQYYIQQPSVYHNRIELLCVEYDELANKQLPACTVQKDQDNGISYFPNAPDESFGKAIPIVLGNFASATTDLIYFSYNFCPAIRIDKINNDYIICSHRCNTVANPYAFLYRFIDEAGTMMSLTGDTSSVINTRAGYKISLSTAGSIVWGAIYLPLTKIIASGYFTFVDNNCIDKDATTFTIIPYDTKMAFQLGYTLSELGTIFKLATSVQVRALIKSDTGSSVDVSLGNYYSMVGADNDPVGFVYSADATSAVTTQTTIASTIGETLNDAWKPNDLTDRYFIVSVGGGPSDVVDLYHIYLMLTHIKVYDDKQIKNIRFIPQKFPHVHIGIGGF